PRPRAPRRARGAPRLRPTGALAPGALRPGAGALGGDLRPRVGVAVVLAIEGGLGGPLRATPRTVAPAKPALGRRLFRRAPRSVGGRRGARQSAARAPQAGRDETIAAETALWPEERRSPE